MSLVYPIYRTIDILLRMCGNLISDPTEHFSKLTSVKKIPSPREKILFHRPCEACKSYNNGIKELFGHLRTITTAFFLCAHRRELIHGVLERRNTKQLGTKAAFAILATLFLKKRRKQTKKRWADEHRKLSIAAYVHTMS